MQTLKEEMECRRKECKTRVCKQIIPTLNVKISLNVNCYTASKVSAFGFFQVRIFPYSVKMWENTNHYGHFSPHPYVSKSPIQHYLYFNRTFRKWYNFCLNGLILPEQKMILISKKRFFIKWVCVNMRNLIKSQISIAR